MKNRAVLTIVIIVPVLLSAIAGVPSRAAAVTSSYLYTLSNFTGTVPYSWAALSVDREANEVYVISNGTATIFNDRGMEIYHFGDGFEIGFLADVAIDKNGNMLVLSYQGNNPSLTVCNFRGEPVSHLDLKNLPPELSKFAADRMVFRDGLLYLVSLGSMRIVIVDTQGFFKEALDVAALIGLDENGRADTGILGFTVDSRGNILITVPAIGSAYIIAPDRTVRSFGKRGSAPGKFGVPAGIVTDNAGNILVADTLRCVVIVFDKDFKYLTEFGYRGDGPGNLIGPRELAIDNNSRLYVTQLRRRGVSVFQMSETGAERLMKGGG